MIYKYITIANINKFVIPFLFIGWMFYVLFCPHNQGLSSCDIENIIKSKNVNGKIIAKYIDIENHSYKMIKLIRSNGQKVKLDFSFDKSGFYDYIEIDDTLIKEQGSIEVRVKNKNKNKNKIYILDYNCVR
jgi:hypothetical protein